MELLYRVSTSIVSFAFLCIVFHIARIRLDAHNKFNLLFLKTCRLVLVALLLESVVVALNGRADWCAGGVLRLLFAFLFALPPVLSYYWLLFSRVLTGDDGPAMKPSRKVCLIPVCINVGLTVLSIFFDLLFTVDDRNVYREGPLFFLSAVFTYFYLVAAFLILFVRRKRLMKESFQTLALICLMPILGGAVQVAVPKLLFMWSFTAGALIVMYVYLQERMIQIDSLTGAWTRRSFYQRMNQVAERCTPGRYLGILFLDIDDFKKINDRYGHAEGDVALKTFTAVVKTQLREEDVLARLGGDEFGILAYVDGEASLKRMEERIHAALERYNDASSKPYALRCSVGTELYNPSDGVDVALNEVDRLMYEQKRAKKEAIQKKG